MPDDLTPLTVQRYTISQAPSRDSVTCQLKPPRVSMLSLICRISLLEQKNDQVSDRIDDKMVYRMNDEMGDRMNDRIDDEMGDRMNDQMGDRMDDRIDDHMDSRMNDQMDDRMNDQMDDHISQGHLT